MPAGRRGRGHGGRPPRGPPRGRRLVPTVPAPRRLPRARGPDEGRPVPRFGVLGPTGPRVRGFAGAGPRRRARPRGPRREPDGSSIHGRPERRLALPRPPPSALREPGDVRVPRRWAPVARCVHHGRRPLCATPAPPPAAGWPPPGPSPPSQRNPSPGLLREAMLDDVVRRARVLAEVPGDLPRAGK